jgi:hypothetical protein
MTGEHSRPDVKRFDGCTGSLRCPFCQNRWVLVELEADQDVECPECSEEMPAPFARITELGEGGAWTEVVEVDVPEEVAWWAREAAGEGDRPVEELLNAALTVDLVFTFPWAEEAEA